MNSQRKKRLGLILFIISGIALTTGLVFYALGKDIDLYYTPSQLVSAPISSKHAIRLGGLVEKGSVHFASKGLEVVFVLMDNKNQVKVTYNGVLPALFREGQGIIVRGKINSQGILIADQVLAKHDANYQPPGIKNTHITLHS